MNNSSLTINNLPLKNVPQIRFKGFEGNWEDETIGEVVSEKKRAITLKDHQRYELITVKRRNEGIVSRGHLFGRDILVKNYAQLQAGDFVISKRQVVHGATGMVSPELDGAIVSNEYLVAVNSGKLLTEFLTILASLPAMRQKFFLSSYGVDIEKLFFDAEDWKARNVTIPSIPEQTQIGAYFRELDSLIALHQRKHDKLATLKKAMLQKMFPQPGTTTPEIRFKGFEGDWGKAALGSVSESYSGGTPSVSIRSYYDGHIPFIRSAEINSSTTELKITEQGFRSSSAKMISKGQVLYALYGATSGEVGISQIDGAINQAILAISPNVEYCSEFIAIWLRNKKSSIVGTYLQGGQGNLSGNIVKSLAVDFPCTKEQQKIGTYFRTLDTLITQHSTQLQKLQQLKSACLQKMFV